MAAGGAGRAWTPHCRVLWRGGGGTPTRAAGPRGERGGGFAALRPQDRRPDWAWAAADTDQALFLG